ncbi:MAG: hypothetical protein ACRDGL_00735 [Candidatus Limnocylindrales bacterium]
MAERRVVSARAEADPLAWFELLALGVAVEVAVRPEPPDRPGPPGRPGPGGAASRLW